MYRSEWDAALARASALETQLRQAQSGQQQDAATIAMLSQQLQACNAELARLRGYGAQPMYGVPSYIFPPRGGTILTLGILSLVVCSLMGPIAWSMGNGELARIDAGQVDPTSRGNAQAGRICGMIATILLICCVVFFVFAFALAAGSTHSNY